MTDIRVAAEQARPDDIRAQGWAVAVHNDYRLNGEPHTFWLFTKGDRAVKGEGRTDTEALAQVRAALASLEAALAALPGDTSKEQALDLIGELEAVRTINAPEGYILASGLHTLRRYIEQSHSAGTPAVESSQIAGRDGASAAPSDEGSA